ncbi:MAG: hypothetical protein QOJ40_1368, partial [Verrucomicrobiota bacterium]
FLSPGERQNRIKNLKPLQEIRQAAAIAIYLDIPRQFFWIISRQCHAEFVGQFSNSRDSNRPIEVQMQIDLGQGLEVHWHSSGNGASKLKGSMSSVFNLFASRAPRDLLTMRSLTMSEPKMSSEGALQGLDGSQVALWREAMAHLRHLSDDVWTGLKLFLILNGFVLISIGLLAWIGPANITSALLLAALAVLGSFLSLTARYILKRHRIYYLQMLAKKSLLEAELGFYRKKFSDSETDLAFPWRLTPEVVAEIKQGFDAWVQKSVRARGTIARVQFCIYETLICLYCLLLLFAAIYILR